MNEESGWLVASEPYFRLIHGKFKTEVVMSDNRLWVWWKSDSESEWTLREPSEIVVDEEQ
ncbi:hypothetical protein KNU49_gp138 [Streptomyces phage EGole]|uniref:Uncharacterized protein n=1 Tax=Streptomyces phage EGole TaxID=2517973 RepID=A0A482JAM3_9CAUD|nr:hypothetical protein KNU49_gp138 [Streptomyces phage EGole]QBP30920.1 hypothetical protein SEA_EGOLE_152 [Streptomyces phage EGole]